MKATLLILATFALLAVLSAKWVWIEEGQESSEQSNTLSATSQQLSQALVFRASYSTTHYATNSGYTCSSNLYRNMQGILFCSSVDISNITQRLRYAKGSYEETLALLNTPFTAFVTRGTQCVTYACPGTGNGCVEQNTTGTNCPVKQK